MALGGAEMGSWAVGGWGEAQGEREWTWRDRANCPPGCNSSDFPLVCFLLLKNHLDKNIVSKRLFGLSCVMVTNIPTVCKWR